MGRTIKIIKNETGLNISITTNFDFTDVTITTAEVKIKKPDDTVLSRTATLSDTETGAFYTTITDPNDFNTPGIYYVWLEVTLQDGSTKSTFSEKVYVYEKGTDV